MKASARYYEKYHRVTVSPEMARSMVVLSERYINDRFLPDKAIDLLDEACSCAALRNKEMAEYDELNKKLLTSRQRVEELESDPEHLDYEQLAKIEADQLQMAAKLDELKPMALGAEVTSEDVAKVIELWTGIPASKIKESELNKVARLEETFEKENHWPG